MFKDTTPALNTIAEQLNELNSGMEKFYEPVKQIAAGGIDLNTLVTAVAGLLGVLVGAFISYYFSKKISDQNTRARIAIQRKNLIFSKLFKELVFINKTVGELPDSSFYFEIYTQAFENEWSRYSRSDFYFAGDRYTKPEYLRWYEMKNDIRKTLVPQELRSKLDGLEGAFRNYYLSLQKFNKEADELEKSEATKMLEIYQQAHPNTRFDIDTGKLFFRDSDIEQVVEENVKRYALKDAVLLDEMRKIISKLLDLPSRHETIRAFDKLKSDLEDTLMALEKTIQRIVDTYEYGDTL